MAISSNAGERKKRAANVGCTFASRLFGIDLRQDSENPRWESRAILRLGESHHYQGPVFGHFIQVGEELNLVMVSAKDVRLQRVIPFTGSEARVSIGWLMADGGDFAHFKEVFKDLHTPFLPSSPKAFIMQSKPTRR